MNIFVRFFVVFTVLLILLTTYLCSLAQTVYNIKTYNRQTIDISKKSCNVFFSSSDATKYNGKNQYASNEDYLITFYSGSADKRVQILFGVYQVSSSTFTYDTNTGTGILYLKPDDVFEVYDDQVVNPSMVMHKFKGLKSYLQLGVYKMISSSSYITIHFKSLNNATNFDSFLGWKGKVSCVDIPPKPQGTTNNPAAENFCSSAPSICNLDGYYGNTSEYYTSDLPGNLCEYCDLFRGTIQNNSWITFVADSTDALLEVSVGQCTNGIQFAVYSGSNCNNFKIISDTGYTTGNLSYNNAGKTISVKLPWGKNPKLVPGNTYYIMVDGLGGDVCDYTIKAKGGVTLRIDAGADVTICHGDQIQLNASGGQTYKWSPTEGLSNPDIGNPLASPTVTTTYTVTATGGANPECQQTNSDKLIITVKDCDCVAPSLTVKANNSSDYFAYCSRGGGGESIELSVVTTGGSKCFGKWLFSWFDGSKFWDGNGFGSRDEIWYPDTIKPNVVTNLGLNTYTARVKCDAGTCFNAGTVKIIVMSSAGLIEEISEQANGLEHNINIYWTQITGADGYILEYSQDFTVWNPLYEGKLPFYVHRTGDLPNSPFYYRMRVYKANTKCDWNIAGNPIYTACDFPLLKVDNPTSTTVDLTLLPESPVENPTTVMYSLVCKTTNQFVQLDGSLGNSETFQSRNDWAKVTVTNLSENTQYCFYATAKNSNNLIYTEGPAVTQCITTGSCIKPFVKDTALNFKRRLDETILINLEAQGQKPFSYQWMKDTILLTSETNSSFSKTALTTDDNGTYYCIISNLCDTIKFKIFTLTVSDASSISGYILYDNTSQTPVNKTKVYLSKYNGEIIDSITNGVSGDFLFKNVANGEYSLSFKTSKSFNGTDALDALNINKNYVGTYSFTTNLRELAADVNNDSKINSIDALWIKKRYISKTDYFPSGDWLFEKTGKIVVNDNDIVINVKAICFGDVNASYPPSK